MSPAPFLERHPRRLVLVTRPRLLDLFCGAGGAAVGYHRAGFEVVGVDIAPQPNYPYRFVQGDVMRNLARKPMSGEWIVDTDDGLRLYLGQFDAIHASPPCQAFSALGTLSDNEHPDLLGPTRDLLDATGLPWVIENVPGAPMRRDYLLCGSMFGLGAMCRDGVRRQLRRHRWFETNWPVGLQPQCIHEGQPIGVYGDGGGGAMTRGYKATMDEARNALAAPWMNRREVSQAIPPAFTEHIGAALMAHLRSGVAA